MVIRSRIRIPDNFPLSSALQNRDIFIMLWLGFLTQSTAALHETRRMTDADNPLYILGVIWRTTGSWSIRKSGFELRTVESVRVQWVRYTWSWRKYALSDCCHTDAARYWCSNYVCLSVRHVPVFYQNILS